MPCREGSGKEAPLKDARSRWTDPERGLLVLLVGLLVLLAARMLG
mgnify:CR=1 FL=1